jgi:hypothetical protein
VLTAPPAKADEDDAPYRLRGGEEGEAMSYDLAIWKYRSEPRGLDPREVYASILADKPHPSLERFDASQARKAILERLGVDDEGETPMTCEVCDFTGQKANWLLLNMFGDFAAKALPCMIDAAEELGLSLYDPQEVAVNGTRWHPPAPTPPVGGWKLMLELGGAKTVYDPSDKVLVKEVGKMSPWKGRTFAVLTRDDGSFIQAGGGGVACFLERLDKGAAGQGRGHEKDKLLRASQDKPTFRTSDGTYLSLGHTKMVLGQNEWFTSSQVAEAFHAFAHGMPYPDYIRWSEIPRRDESTLKLSDMVEGG